MVSGFQRTSSAIGTHMRAMELRVWAQRLHADLANVIRESSLLKEESRRLRQAPHGAHSFEQVDFGESSFFPVVSLNPSTCFQQSWPPAVADERSLHRPPGQTKSSQ